MSGDLYEYLSLHRACTPALDWIAHEELDTLDQAWRKCDHPDWMIWALDQTKRGSQPKFLAFIAALAELAVKGATPKQRREWQAPLTALEQYARHPIGRTWQAFDHASFAYPPSGDPKDYQIHLLLNGLHSALRRYQHRDSLEFRWELMLACTGLHLIAPAFPKRTADLLRKTLGRPFEHFQIPDPEVAP